MHFRSVVFGLIVVVAAIVAVRGQTSAQTSPSSSSKHVRKSAPGAASPLDAGSVSNGVYRNAAFGLACKIPAGWVPRTEEMNASDEDPTGAKELPTADKATKSGNNNGNRVLLAAFSRPPQARGEEINSSILIAAESADAYPGLKDAAQYFGPIGEIAKAQGFSPDGEPYEVAIDTKTLSRADFHKDVGTRVMRQSTLVMLARGYAVSFTFIGGTEDEVEELIDGLNFAASKK
jgi:hypothetical protein